jgi:hypothetical protein
LIGLGILVFMQNYGLKLSVCLLEVLKYHMDKGSYSQQFIFFVIMTDRHTDRETDGWTDGLMDRCGRMDRQMDGWIYGRTGRQTDSQWETDIYIYIYIYIYRERERERESQRQRQRDTQRNTHKDTLISQTGGL